MSRNRYSFAFFQSLPRPSVVGSVPLFCSIVCFVLMMLVAESAEGAQLEIRLDTNAKEKVLGRDNATYVKVRTTHYLGTNEKLVVFDPYFVIY